MRGMVTLGEGDVRREEACDEEEAGCCLRAAGSIDE